MAIPAPRLIQLPVLPAELTGCVSWSAPDTLFSDCLSAIALGAQDSDVVGISRLFLKGLNGGSIRPLLQPFLRLCALTSSGWEPVSVLRRESHLHGWTEHGMVGDHQIEQRLWFSAVDALCLAWTISGPGPLRIAVMGAPHGDQTTLSGERQGCRIEFQVTRLVANIFIGGEEAVTTRFALDGGLGSSGSFTADVPVPSLAPERPGQADLAASPTGLFWYEPAVVDGAAHLHITWAFGAAAPAQYVAWCSQAEAEARWATRIASLPAPTPDTTYWRRKAAQALATVYGVGIRAPGYGVFADELGIPATCSEWASTAWFWDQCYSSTILAHAEPALTVSALRCHLRHTAGGRMGPGILQALPAYGPEHHMLDCYAPIASWSLTKALRCTSASVDLASILPLLEDFHEGWLAHSDRDGDGIPEWRNTGNPGDNSPLFDRYATKPGDTNFALPPFVSASLLAYLLMDARCLATLAAGHGDHAKAAGWAERAAGYDRVLLERCWDPEEEYFTDLTPEGGRTRVRTFFALLPLWAGVSLPQSAARNAIRRHLLDPAGLWGEAGFPSSAFDEPTHDPEGYWRGRCWPHLCLWNAEILWAYGFEAEANRMRDRLLRVFATWRDMPENWPSDPTKLHRPGLRNYNWGAAALLHFLHGWHQQPVVTPR
jgi:hypothetical protein